MYYDRMCVCISFVFNVLSLFFFTLLLLFFGHSFSLSLFDLLNMAALTGHLGTGSGKAAAPAQWLTPGSCKDV